MKCPYCDKEIDEIDSHENDLDYREFWYHDRVEIVRGIQCPHCNKMLILKEIYRLECRRFFGTMESE